MSQTDRIAGLVGNSAIKVPCKSATTAAITLSGEQTVDGVALVAGDRVLVKNQANAVQNGIYVVDTGDWNFADDADGPYDWTEGSLVFVTDGVSTIGFWYQSTSGVIIPGTTALGFVQASSVLAVISTFWQAMLLTADAPAARTALGLGTAATKNVGVNEGEVVELGPGGALPAVSGANLTNLPTPTTYGSVAYAENVGLNVSLAANAMTIALKDAAGADPSAGSPVNVYAQSATVTTGTVTKRQLTSATSLVVTSGATLGTVNARASRIYVGLLDNGGVLELCVWNGVVSDADGNPTALFRVDPGGVYSTTVMNASADNAGVIYSASARSNVRVYPIGYIDSVQATAGNWATAIERLTILGPGVPRTGDLIQSVIARYTTTGSVTGTTFADSGLTASITPTSKSNPIRASFTLACGADASQGQLFRIIRGSTSILSGVAGGSRTLVTHGVASQGAGYLGSAHLQTMDLPNSVSAATYKIQMASGGAGSVYINRSATDTDGSNYQRGASIEILEEICA